MYPIFPLCFQQAHLEDSVASTQKHNNKDFSLTNRSAKKVVENWAIIKEFILRLSSNVYFRYFIIDINQGAVR